MGRRKSLFVYDVFEVYVIDIVKVVFKRENIDFVVISGGLILIF